VARDGIPYVVIPTILAVVAIALGTWLIAAVFVFITLFMAYFFRDPDRVAPTEHGIVVSPADGRVTRVSPLVNGESDSSTLVSIFLSPLDVHINRSPIAGKVTNVTYKSGKFLMATSVDSSIVNEQNLLTIAGDDVTIVCKQIAGVLARRIVCWKKQGDQVALGERIGLIKFSSRTDLILPSNVEINIQEGDRVRGGETIIGRIR
jgi:phosphatidylserine decarboxylase